MKKFLILVFAISIFCTVCCFAEESSAQPFNPGLYIVGQDIEPGGYTVWVESDKVVEPGKTNIDSLACVTMYLSMDQYLSLENRENTSNDRSVVYIHPEEMVHIGLMDGIIVKVTALYKYPIFIRKETIE